MRVICGHRRFGGFKEMIRRILLNDCLKFSVHDLRVRETADGFELLYKDFLFRGVIVREDGKKSVWHVNEVSFKVLGH